MLRITVTTSMFLLSIMTSTPNLIAEAHVEVDSTTKITNIENAYPCWSPEGAKIVFQSNRSGKWIIYTMDADGSNVTALTDDQDYAVTPSWSPDGSRIVYVSKGGEELEDIWSMNPDGSNRVNITRSPSINESHPHWTPDSRRIVFNSTKDDPFPLDQMEFGYGEEICEMDRDGSNVTRITEWEMWDTFASCSPDGKFIVWRRVILADTVSDRRFNSEIYIMNRDGTKPKNISNHPAFDGYPTWSYDGSSILFVSNRSGREQIYTMSADGTQVQRLVKSQDTDARPNWSLDGAKIAFNRERNGSVDIHVLYLAQ
ncbi:MAG: hypothetical protein V3W19_01660 [Desulfatiglandales bacterium]